MITFNTIFYALLGGILPAIVWLLFWLKEDSRHPESPFLITKTFLVGMGAVVLVLPLEKIVNDQFPGMSSTAFFLWAILEEGFKFAVAYFIAIRTRDDDEPIDSVIYMITVALGFAALENTFFIINPLLQKEIVIGAVVSAGSVRFIGATLLHVVSSSTIGLALALTFFKSTRSKVFWVGLSFILAVVFHTAFNLFIFRQNTSEVFLTYGIVWIAVILLLLFFERIKALRPKRIDI